MDIWHLIRDNAVAAGFETAIYARVDEANELIGEVKHYPLLVRAFSETITETNYGLRRSMTLYFLDMLGETLPNTEAEASPIVERMIHAAMMLFAAMRSEGVEVSNITMRPVVMKFDALLTGVEVSAVIDDDRC